MIWFLSQFYQGMSSDQLILKQQLLFQDWSTSFVNLDPIPNPSLRDQYTLAVEADQRMLARAALTPLTDAVKPLYQALYKLHRDHWMDLLTLPYENWLDYLSATISNIQQAQVLIQQTQRAFVLQFNRDIVGSEDSTLLMDHSETPNS